MRPLTYNRWLFCWGGQGILSLALFCYPLEFEIYNAMVHRAIAAQRNLTRARVFGVPSASPADLGYVSASPGRSAPEDVRALPSL